MTNPLSPNHLRRQSHRSHHHQSARCEPTKFSPVCQPLFLPGPAPGQTSSPSFSPAPPDQCRPPPEPSTQPAKEPSWGTDSFFLIWMFPQFMCGGGAARNLSVSVGARQPGGTCSTGGGLQCCSVLYCTAMYCNVLQWTAMYFNVV